MTAINPKARAAALRCLEAGMPLLVIDGNVSGELAVDDANAFASVQQARDGRAAIYQTGFPLSLKKKPARSARTMRAQGIEMNSERFAQRVAARKKIYRFLAQVLKEPTTTPQLQKAPVFDHVPHSTAAELRRKGINVVTEMVEVVGYAGRPAHVAKYSIAPESRSRALQILGSANE